MSTDCVSFGALSHKEVKPTVIRITWLGTGDLLMVKVRMAILLLLVLFIHRGLAVAGTLKLHEAHEYLTDICLAVAADENPGFAASFLADKTFTRTGWTELVDWSSNASRVASHFAFGPGSASAAASTGRYAVPRSGVYLVTATVKLNSATGSHFRLLVSLNNNHIVNNAMNAIIGPPPSSSYTLTATGAMQINAKEYISVLVYSESDTNWKILAGSFFSVRYLGPEKSHPGFLATKSNWLG